MSWKDSLDNYDNGWKRHERWRKTAKVSNTPGVNAYTEPVPHKTNQILVSLSDMPEDLRTLVIEKIENAVRVLVDYANLEAREKLRRNAIAEARATILDLEGAGAAPPVRPDPPMPQDPTGDVTRLGRALAAIETPDQEEP